MKEVALINTCWLKPFADFFTEKNVGLEPYCEVAQIQWQQINSGEGWITKHQLYLFLDALAKGERMPEVGFVVGELITPDCLGDLGRAMAQADTLGGVIRTFCELINRHVEGNHCRLEEGNEGEVWFFNTKSQSADPGRVIADHAGLMSMINLVRLAGGSSWYPREACLQTGSTSAFQKVSGLRSCEFAFNQSATGFAFPSAWLLKSTRPNQAPGVVEDGSDGLLGLGEALNVKIERLLREIIGIGGMCPTIRLMADLCDTSARTLHRRLEEAGESYRKLLDRVRHELACARLEDSEISIKELAYGLGYSGPNNFIRSFKRLHGCTPSGYRDARRSDA